MHSCPLILWFDLSWKLFLYPSADPIGELDVYLKVRAITCLRNRMKTSLIWSASLKSASLNVMFALPKSSLFSSSPLSLFLFLPLAFPNNCVMRTWWRHQMEKKNNPRYWHFAGIHRSPVNSPYTGQGRGALMFSWICACINSWINNREAGDLRRNRAHYDVIVMKFGYSL